jgi:hypothetical protein
MAQEAVRTAREGQQGNKLATCANEVRRAVGQVANVGQPAG